MYLKTYLREALNRKKTRLKVETSRTKKAIGLLDKIDLNNADYTVDLHSLWANEGERSITKNYTGSLKEAVKSAEAKFKSVNDRTDVQAEYSVEIQIGDIIYPIPRKYWGKYISRR